MATIEKVQNKNEKKEEKTVINKLIGKIFFKSHTAFIMAFLANRDEMNDFMSYGFFLN